MMIPRKIDDRLKDAIVDIRFSSSIPPGTIPGYFHRLLKQEFDWLPSIQSKEATSDTYLAQFVHKSGFFRADVQDNGVTFNIVEGYKGWNDYERIISITMSSLFNEGIVSTVQQVSIRYISHFDQVHLFEKTAVPLPNIIQGASGGFSQYRTEFTIDELYCIITLVDGFPNTMDSKLEQFFSIIDIDILRLSQNNEFISFEALIYAINSLHDKMKHLFFSLLSESFVNTLNPVS